MAADNDWSKPQALAIPKEGYFTLERDDTARLYPRTPASHGFTIIAKIKPGTEEEIRAYGKEIEKTLSTGVRMSSPRSSCTICDGCSSTSAPTRTSCIKASSIPISTSTPKTRSHCSPTGINTIFEKLEGFPEDWKTNVPAFIKFVREHQCPSFLEYGEYPYVTATRSRKRLQLKQAVLVDARPDAVGAIDRPGSSWMRRTFSTSC